jgi:hypothetical protein
MYVKAHTIKVSFVTKSGVRVERTVTLTDTSRSKAEFRALAVAVPATATNAAVVK